MKKKPLLIIVVLLLLLSGCNTQPVANYHHSNLPDTSSIPSLITEILIHNTSFRPLEWSITVQQTLLPEQNYLKTEINTPIPESERFSTANNTSPVSQPAKSTKQNQASEQSQDLFPLLIIFMIVLIVIVLVVLALIYFRKTQFGQKNSNIGTPESIRYDSKISLCSLVFDQLNSVLYISHGKKNHQINFAELARYELLSYFARQAASLLG